MYDKLGDLLSEALKTGFVPKSKKYKTQDTQSVSVEEVNIPPRLHKCFNLLGLPINASYDECHKAYREKLKLLHPDTSKFSNDSTEVLEVIEAFDKIKSWFMQAR